MDNTSLTAPGVPAIVYVIKNPLTNMVKIGYTKNIRRRLSEIQNMSGMPLEVIYTTEYTKEAQALEIKAHREFKECRVMGEWFKLDAANAVEFLERECNEE